MKKAYFQKFTKKKFLEFLKSINYNDYFNKIYYFVILISIFFATFVLITNKVNLLTVLLDLLFFSLFIFELFVRYLAIGNFQKFWKFYYLDVIALIGWIPLYYFAEFALLRAIRLLRLFTIFRIITFLDKKLRLLFENILIIFITTLIIVVIVSTIIHMNNGEDILTALKWSLYVIFTSEMPHGLEEKYPFYLGIGLIMSNGILVAAAIGTVSSYIMEKFKNITSFDNIPNTDIILVINYDKEIISSFLKQYFESIKEPQIKITLVSKISHQEYNNIITFFENLNIYNTVLQNVFVVNEDPLLPSLYEKLIKIKEKIKKIFILPDERIENDYHKDTNVAFIATNIINYLGKEFASKKLVAVTITNIVNLPNVYILRSYEVIAKLINLKIHSYTGFLDQFLLSFHNKLTEIPLKEILLKEENFPLQLNNLIKYIKQKYNGVLIGYIKTNGEVVNILNQYLNIIDLPNNTVYKPELIETSEIQSFLIVKQ